MKLIRVGVDLAKNVFQIHGVDRSEKAIWRRKLVRGDWINARNNLSLLAHAIKHQRQVVNRSQ